MTNVCLNFKIEEYKLNLNRLIEGSLLVSKVLNTQWATKRLFINQQRLKWRWKLEFLCLWTSSVMKVRLSHIKCWHLSISYFKSVIYMLGQNFILIACMQAYKCVTTKQCGFFCLLGRDTMQNFSDYWKSWAPRALPHRVIFICKSGNSLE